MRKDTFSVKNFPDLTGFKAPESPPRPLRVCIVTEEIIGPIRNGGIASTYTHLAKLLVSEGHEVTVLFLKGIRSEIGTIESWIDHYRSQGIKLVPLPQSPAKGASFWQQRQYRAYVWLKNQQTSFDVVHGSEWRGGLYYALLAKRMGLAFDETLFVVKCSSPVIWNRHYMMEFLPDLNLLAVMFSEQRSVELGDLVVGGSAHLISFMEHVGYILPEERCYVQPNVLTFEELQIVDNRGEVHLGDRIKTRDLVFFGRLESRKGLEIFCDALDFLVARNCLPDHVTFLGKLGLSVSSAPNIECDDFIRSRAVNWPFDIDIITHCQQQEALSYLVDKPRIAVMPSLIENSSMAVYEALTYKIPFIATAIGGTPELIVEDDISSVLTEADPRNLANRMEAALTDGGLVARCSFDNDKNLEIWRDFHLHMAARVASDTLSDLNPALPTGPLPTLSLCVFAIGSGEAVESFVKAVLKASGGSLSDIVLAATAPEALTSLAHDYGPTPIHILDAWEMSLGEAWNAAAEVAKGDNLFFLRSDIHLPQDGFDTVLATAFLRSRADGLSTFWLQQEGTSDDLEESFVGVPIGPDIAMGMINRWALSGNGVAVSSATFKEIGGFATIFGIGSIQQDLMMRVAAVGNLDLVPEPIYIETASASFLPLNEFNAQFMTVSSQIDASPYYLKRLYLVLGFLQSKKNIYGLTGLRSWEEWFDIADATSFQNAVPPPDTGYPTWPRMRVILNNDTGDVRFVISSEKQPSQLFIEAANKQLKPLSFEIDSYKDWVAKLSLRDLDLKISQISTKVVATLDEEGEKPPRRSFDLIALTNGTIRVSCYRGFIENAGHELQKPGLDIGSVQHFEIANPLPESGYDRLPKIRILLNSENGRIFFALPASQDATGIEIFLNEQSVGNFPFEGETNGEKYAVLELKSLRIRLKKKAVKIIGILRGDLTTTFRRKLSLSANEDQSIRVSCEGNFIEILDTDEKIPLREDVFKDEADQVKSPED